MRRYARFLIPAVVVIGVLGFLMVNLSSSLVYYNTPAEVQAREASGANLRLAGRVVSGSVVEQESTVAFRVADCGTSVSVIHTGVPPQLFQEGITVVVGGQWNGVAFESDELFVKHDEQYRSDAEDYNRTDNSCSES